MKNLYCAYYTNSEPINKYMVKMLYLNDGEKVLEPSAGEGVFVESVLSEDVTDLQIDALDINKTAINILHKKFDDIGVVNIKETNTLFDEQLDIYAMVGGYYDKVIGNPPYGAWQEYSKRKDLKKKYPGYYVKESYTLFLLRSLTLLKDGGRLSFIIPDTFLYLNLHKEIRRTLLQNSCIEEILIFPSKFFPGVSFGYSNLSIITLKKTSSEEKALNNKIRIIKGFKDVNELPDVLENKFSDYIHVYILRQSEILANQNSRFLLSDNPDINLTRATVHLGDIADVVTGLYTGDNKRFIVSRDKSVKGAKNYSIVDPNEISEKADLTGIQEPNKHYVPYIKSASSVRYARPTDDWFVQWDKDAIDFYIKNKKSRFQNSAFYFKKGIAIPMVKASKLRATYMNNRVFDQSIVGIFPREEKYFFYILTIMNSDIVCDIIHMINPTANNSSNYVKQIPFVKPSNKELLEINQLVEQAINYAESQNGTALDSVSSQLNEIINDIYMKGLN